MNIEIRSVALAEVELLSEIAKRTFEETFRDTNSEEDMEQYLAEALSSAKLTEELRNPGSEFYFALCEGQVVGYLKTNTGHSQTELKDVQSFEVERIYVLSEYHGKKVGQALFEKAMELAHQAEAEFVWLGVWEKNHRALGFYKKNGFVEFDTHVFQLGSDEQTDIMMKKIL